MRKQWARQVFAVVFLALLAFPLGAQEIKKDFYQGEEVVAQQVLVKFRPEAQSNMAQAMAAVLVAQDIEKAEGVGGTGILLLESRSKDVATLMDQLAANPDVEYVEPNYILHTTEVPDDPRFPELWGLRNLGTPGADISAVPAWDITTGWQGIVVGVIDTGIVYNHADLFSNVWSAPTDFSVTIGGQTIDCPAGSHGYRPVQRTCDPAETTNTHGTHVSGTIGATGNNGLGVVGVNWTASILGCKM